jgi:hypothetical protein
MMKKRLKNIAKISGLITIRQGYFLLRNWYKLYSEPEETLDNLWETKDKSQIFLLTLTAFLPILIYFGVRIIWDLIVYGNLVLVTGKVFEAAVVVQGILLIYLGYWIINLFYKKNGST